MNIETLVLSGGSTSGIAYIGVFKALLEHNIISNGLKGIKHVITTSAGIFFSILMIIDVNLEVIKKINHNYDYSDMLVTDKIHIDNILLRFGLFTNEKVGEFVSTFLKHTIQKETLTLLEFYKLYNIKLSVKVCNVTKSQIEYINHETDPDMDLMLLVRMTTAIPLLFEPILYKDCQYVDGGLKNGYPIEYVDTDNFLGIKIHSQGLTSTEINIPIVKFITNLFMCTEKSYFQDKHKDRTYQINISNNLLNFTVSEEQKNNIIQQGYEQTLDYIKTIPITSD
tara:strand:+ start:499 stop:1344 length:846 start_codon:yes stop_codon:yes gene_type:complete